MLRKKLKLDVSEGSAIPEHKTIASKFLELERELNDELMKMIFPAPVVYVYDPLKYALQSHSMFIEKYLTSDKKIMFLGMNPGPFGMCQTGIPFGEVDAVRSWFNIECDIGKPAVECPDRKITGFNCTRSEVSGKRFWDLFRELCGIPEKFFKYAYLYNYCPIALMAQSGKNITPADIKGKALSDLEDVCDKTLLDAIELLKVEIVVGLGRYAEKRAIKALAKRNPLNTRVVYMPHPSPRSVNNNNWSEKAKAFLQENELMHYFQSD